MYIPSATLFTRARRLTPYFGHQRLAWITIFLATIVGALTEPLIPALFDRLIELGFVQRQLNVWMVPAALMGLFGIRGLAGYVAQIGLSHITNRGLLKLRQRLFEQMLVAPLSLFQENSSSTLSNAIVYETQTGATMLVNSVLSLTRNGLTLMALVGYLLYLNWKLTLIVIAMFPTLAWVMRVLTRRLHKLTKDSQGATDDLAYVVEENVLAHRDVRMYAAQPLQAQRFGQLGDLLRKIAVKSTIAGAAMTPLTQLLAAAALSMVVSIALIQSASAGTSVGEFVAFVTAMLMIIAPIRQLSEVAGPITRGLAALERGLDLIHDAPSEAEGHYECHHTAGNIDFDDVSVCYSSTHPPVIAHFSFHIRAGQTIAIVGASGAGKSTLVHLLPRLVDVTSGRICIDGHSLNDWKLASLRAQFALVSQHVVMLNDSIAANIALGLPLNRDRVHVCMAAANLAALVAELPLGIDTIVGHNAMQLSGGQRQRLAIARALYKDAPILILDEATSALDAESERLVQDALQKLMKGRTTLVIAHRLSTVMHADQIITLDSGHIVEAGTHDELLQRGGHYARLYQLGLGATPAATA